MKLLALALAVPGLLASPLSAPGTAPADHRIPTSYESAVMGRRVLALSKLADFSTTFPVSTPPDSADNAAGEGDVEALARPSGIDGLPVNMMEYVADCEDTGNPTVLAVKIGTTYRNVAAGSNVSVSLRWMPPYPPSRHIRSSLWDRLTGAILGHAEEDSPPDTVPYSAANLPRMSLMGHLEPIEPSTPEAVRLAACFVKKHPDAKYWLPGNPIHSAYWARLVVEQVLWVGGFGDRAYIGWIPIEEWRAVTGEEWGAIRLPGEKEGWHEWSVEGPVEVDL